MSVNRVPVKADMLRWARERSGADIAVFDKRFPQLDVLGLSIDP